MIDFDSVYAAQAQLLLGYVSKRVPSRQEAEDVVQTVFMRLTRHLEKLPTDEDVKKWLYTVARNECIDRARSAWTAHVLPPSEDLSDLMKLRAAPDNTEDDVVRVETHQLFHQAFSKLPAHYQRCLRLLEWEGKGIEEIAAITGENGPTIKSRAYRARMKLKEIILEHPEFATLAA